MKITITKGVKSIYLEKSDEWDSESENTTIELDRKKLLTALADILYDDYFRDNGAEMEDRTEYALAVKKGIKSMIDDCDIVDDLAEICKVSLVEYFND